LGFVAGTWDSNEAINAVLDAKDPTLMICGTADGMTFSYLNGLWSGLVRPKHQAAIQGLGHWDWFGYQGAIRPCDPKYENEACPVGWQIASELLLGFMRKYLLNRWWHNPYLLGPAGERPPLLSWFEEPMSCAVKIRWDDPLVSDSFEPMGEKTFGAWTEQLPPW
jgi:hypothetical protein